MKSTLNRIATALVVASLASGIVLGKSKKEAVTFQEDIKVNGTLVNKGSYEIKFDDKTEELSIMKGSKVIARASTTVAKRDRKARTLEVKSTRSGDQTELTSVAFGGMDHDLVVNNSQASR
ncbi:MAG: hypothetical protein ABR501_00685 [Pyrinomonadaceae bacterium]